MNRTKSNNLTATQIEKGILYGYGKYETDQFSTVEVNKIKDGRIFYTAIYPNLDTYHLEETVKDFIERMVSTQARKHPTVGA